MAKKRRRRSGGWLELINGFLSLVALLMIIGQPEQAKLAFDVRGPVKLDWHDDSNAQLSLVDGKKAAKYRVSEEELVRILKGKR